MPFDYQTVQYRSLQRRSVVITGGASGIGEEIVKAFVAQGARVSLIDIDAEKGAALASETGASFHRCDVTDIQALRESLARVEHEHHGIDVLVNNAGKDDRHDMEQVEPDDWRRALALNLDHLVFCHAGGLERDGKSRSRLRRHAGLRFLDARPPRYGRLHHRQGSHQRHDSHTGPRTRFFRHPSQLHRARRYFD